jgi:ATP-dependent helicase/nuclease subunit A
MLITPAFSRFNEAQRHALDTGRNLAVRAGAGSGKTSVLVERIVQLLAAHRSDAEPFQLDHLVALTFTRKAAGELQDRLRQAFQERADAGDTDFWRAQQARLADAMIGTIDAFCARVLRELGHLDPQGTTLEPDFEPLSDFDERTLRHLAVERVLDRLHTARESDADPEERARAVAARWWGETQGYETLIRHLVTLLNHAVDPEVIVSAHAAQGPALERVQAEWDALPAVRRLRSNGEQFRHDLEAIIHDVDARHDAGDCMITLRTGLLDVLAALDLGTRAGEEQALTRLAEALLTRERTPRVQGLNKLAELVQPVQDVWCPLLARFAFDFDAEVRARDAADRLALLLEPVHDEYQRLCRSEGRYDFLTLARRTRDLLRRVPAVRHALKERYRYLMIDEFQDTNHLQWEILAWLVGDGPVGRLDADRLFLVGDPQQSIYRFRHADVSVFHLVEERVQAVNAEHGHAERPTDYDGHGAAQAATPEQRLGLMPLRENYRTLAPMPLQIVDRVFAYVFDPLVHELNPEANPFEVRYQPLVAGLSPASPGEVCYVLPQLPEEDEGDSEAEEPPPESVALPQVQMVVEQLARLHGTPRIAPRPDESATLRWGDMAVLLPSRDVVLTELEREFRRRGVPFLVHKGIGFWQRQEVRDIVSLVLSLADPGDDLALFATLRGPVGQLADRDIFFLSQVGGERLGRGLDRLATLTSDDLSVLDGWSALAAPARLVLNEHWQNLAVRDRAHLLEAMRSIRRWRDRVDRIAHADLLQRALEESGAYALYAAEAEADTIFANLGKLFDIIRERESDSLTSLAYELRERVDDAEKEEQAPAEVGVDAVQVMTVHAAKGLEFPVVAVMKLDRRAVRPMAHRLRVLGPHDSLLAADTAEMATPAPGSVSVAVRHPRRPREIYVPRLLRALIDLDAAQALAESRRLFYVAATRARERLILAGRQPRLSPSGKPMRMHECWQRWFEEALGITPEDKARGAWEDAGRGQRITIMTTPTPMATDAPTDPPFVPTARLDLGSLAAGKDRRPEERLGRDHAGLVGAVVQQTLADPRGEGTQRNLDGEALARLAAAVIRQRAREASTSPPAPAAITAIADAAGSVLGLLGQGNAVRARALLTAEGLNGVPFRLEFADRIILGRFDRLLKKENGYEVIAWTDEEADEERRLSLLALVLYVSGRAALNEGRVIVHRLRVESAEVKVVGFTPEALTPWTLPSSAGPPS